jgi:hypothetical protein
MKNETILRGSLVLTILGSLWMMVMWNNDIIVITKQKNTIDSLILKNNYLTYQNDSLRDENFIKGVDNGRDELTWEFVKEKFPNVYNNAMNYKSHETE